MHTKRFIVTLSLLALGGAAHAQGLPSMPPAMDAMAATNDPAVLPEPANHAIFLPGISTDLIFVPPGRMTQDREAGTARLTGRVVDAHDSTKIFDVDINFTGLSIMPPAGSPKRGLRPNAYIENGGPVDPSTWYYYTSFDLQLTGAGAFDGAVLQGTQRGPAPQFGNGANDKNTRYGFSGWFDWVVVQQPTQGGPWAAGGGDLNIDLQADCLCAEDSAPDAAYTTNLGTGALGVSPAFGCDTQWHLAATSILETDHAAKTAKLTGELVASVDPACRFAFEITLSGRLEPGDPGYPPPGSPLLAHILPSGLFVNGGAIDPGSWAFYTGLNGTLLGKGSLMGAHVTLTTDASATAAQLGAGAARNTKMGVHAPVSLRVDQQPIAGPGLSDADGALWLELAMCDRPVFVPHGINAPPMLPTVTDQCFTLRGCAMDTVKELNFAGMTITSQDPCDFGLGYFEILDEMTLKFCPPLCIDPATLSLVAKDELGAASDPLPLTIVEPSAPTLAVAPALRVGCVQHMWIWGGPTGPLGYCLFFSGSNLPSVLPGIVTLGIGNQWTNFIGIDTMGPNCFDVLIGTVPVEAIGITLYFQAIPMDMHAMVLPFVPTNVGSTSYSQ
jgi:hypothetical protein